MHDNGRCSQRVATVLIAIAMLAVLLRLAFGVAIATTISIGMTAAVAMTSVAVTAVARAAVERTATYAAPPTRRRRRQARHIPSNGNTTPPQSTCSPAHPGPIHRSRANCSTTRRPQTGNPTRHRRETFTTIPIRTANPPQIEFIMKTMTFCY